MKLSAKTLSTAHDSRLPGYDRTKITPGLVHLGIGNFHRAHQAAYLDACLAAEPDWGIIGVSLRKPDVAEALNPQDGLYTLLERDEQGTRARIVGSVLKVVAAQEGTHSVLKQLTAPECRIVSLTITEKGYGLDPASGRLDPALPEIREDLERPRQPRTAAAIIVEALRQRREAGLAPFTLLCCDNLPANGKMLARLAADFAALHSDRLAQWIETNLTAPSTMVDRIVPATTDDDRDEARAITGLEDRWPVAAEAFSQWVVEDAFVSGRPDLASAGVTLVSDVAPYERMKLRMLNGAHSALAYMGQLRGFETVREALSNRELAAFIHELWREEIMPTLNRPRAELESYAVSLSRRFLNPGMRHLTAQIAMDGSQKIPQRILGTVRDRLAAGQGYERLASVVAAWVLYLARGDNPEPIRDPLAPRFASLRQASGGNTLNFATSLLNQPEIFGDLSRHPGFCSAVTAAVQRPLMVEATH